MAAAEHPSVAAMWADYLRSSGLDPATRYASWRFSDNARDANQLVRLVLAGKKRATAPSVWELEGRGEPVPRVGDHAVVTDGAGVARCVVRTTRVTVVPFGEVSAEFAATEGEGDGSLAHWRKVHRAYYTRVLRPLGRAPTPDMPIACEEFEVVFPVLEPEV